MKLEPAGPPEPKCGKRRGKWAHTYCELPPGHLGKHLGRSRTGKWFSWWDSSEEKKSERERILN